MFMRLTGLLFLAAGLVTLSNGVATADGPAAIIEAAPTPIFSPTPSPGPATLASPAPSPSASAKAGRRLSISAIGSLSAANQQFVGPGISPAEGPAFAAGSIVAPGTPYDYFTNAPLTTGFGFNQSLRFTPTYRITPGVDISAEVGYGSISGSANVAGYWGEQPLPQLNAHLGQRQVPLPVKFTTHNGQDPIKGGILGLTKGSIATHDGMYALRVGFIDLSQTLGFVFNAPPITNAPGALAPTLPETIGDPAPATSSGFAALSNSLPLHGIDFTAKHGIATIELANADLPTVPETPARMSSASVLIDHGSGLTYGAQAVHIKTGGAAEATTLLFGNAFGQNFTVPSSQGNLPFSLIGGQRNTIFGLTATAPLGGNTDVAAKYGYSQYAADGTYSGSGSVGGSYYYGKVHHAFSSFEVSAEAVRFEPNYAPTQIQYGTLENIWSLASSWPGTWLKGNYPLADVTMVGPNRQGFRVSGDTIVHGIDLRLAYGAYRQIFVDDFGNSHQPGFVEGYFLPQLFGGATLGREQHAAASVNWHPKFADVQLDLTDVTMSRPAALGNPNDAVAMNYPAGTFTVSRQLNSRIFAAVGAARYAIDGSFSNSGAKNTDLAQSVVYGGFQYTKDGRQTYHLQYRLYSVHGLPTVLNGPSPAFHGPQLILEQRFKL